MSKLSTSSLPRLSSAPDSAWQASPRTDSTVAPEYARIATMESLALEKSEDSETVYQLRSTEGFSRLSQHPLPNTYCASASSTSRVERQRSLSPSCTVASSTIVSVAPAVGSLAPIVREASVGLAQHQTILGQTNSGGKRSNPYPGFSYVNRGAGS